jgi:hypothetical protein
LNICWKWCRKTIDIHFTRFPSFRFYKQLMFSLSAKRFILSSIEGQYLGPRLLILPLNIGERSKPFLKYHALPEKYKSYDMTFDESKERSDQNKKLSGFASPFRSF